MEIHITFILGCFYYSQNSCEHSGQIVTAAFVIPVLDQQNPRFETETASDNH